MRQASCALVLLLAGAPSLVAKAAAVERLEVGNCLTEHLPAIPPALFERLNQYQNTRGASLAGWLQDGSILITTRFADTVQTHRVRMPMGMREQLTFYPEPTRGVATRPATAGNGFVFGKDIGGNEFWQLYHYDLAGRVVTQVSRGARSRNDGALWADDGRQLAYSSTERNGTDTDIWLVDVESGERRALVTEGGSWSAADFSPDGKRLIVIHQVSANESYPGEVDLTTGRLRMLPVDGGKASFGDFLFAPDGKGAYFVSDEGSEWKTLRHHDVASNRLLSLSGSIPWDVETVKLSGDGKHLAYVTNEDGISHLRVLALPEHREIAVPELPVGVIGGLYFSPEGTRLALAINSANSPSDVYVIDLAEAKLVRWTASEVGGLDAQRLVTPTLIRYPSFDGRSIPAFYYRPRGAQAKLPVVIQIHGGPESQATPTFNPTIQYLVNELGVAVLVPNVRGSSGYGKTYLTLDNGVLRKDSVKDIGALLDWIAQNPELDATRVGVSGGSYGGYMVLASLVDYNDRLRAGIEIVGISHFKTFLQNTESYRRDLRRVEYGDEREPAIAAFHDSIAPLNHAGKINRPLFVAQGLNDPRVPYTEAEQIIKAVRGNGGEVWYLLCKDEGHGFAKKSNTDYYGAASMLFWEKYLLR
jgi:dipeptidyl aminopeptidase/acylaminoacyl peptidase